MPAYTHMQASISEKGISSPIFSRILDGMLIVRWDEQRLWVWILPSSPCLSIHCVPCPGISWSWRFKLEVSPGRSECMCLQAARSREAGVHPIHPSGPQGSVVSITCSQPTASDSWRNAWRCMWPWSRSASFFVSFDHWEGCLEEGFGIQCTWESSRNARQDPFPRESAHFLNLSIFTRASAEINFMDRFFIFICNFCLASNKQSKASSFLTQGLNPGLPHCRQTLYHVSHQGSLLSRETQTSNLFKPPFWKKHRERDNLHYITVRLQNNH